MPKASTSVAWQSAAAPQTPLQRGAFLDACVEWLVAPADAAVERLTPRTATHPPPARGAGGAARAGRHGSLGGRAALGERGTRIL